MEDVILFVTAGRTDIDIVKDGKRFLIEIKATRKIHESLLCIDKIEWYDGDKITKKEESKISDEKIIQESGCVKLYPAKLIEIVKYIEDKANGNEWKVKCCVVFGTHRENTIDEPVGVGPLLSKWLSKRLNLTYGGLLNPEHHEYEGNAYYFNYLTGSMLANDAKENFPVNREAMITIDNIMRSLNNSIYGCKPIFINAGGLPEYKEQIKACIDYRFSADPIVYNLPERLQKDHSFIKIEQKGFSPAEEFRVRKISEQLFNNGEYVAAGSLIKSVFKKEHPSYAIVDWCYVLTGVKGWDFLQKYGKFKFSRALFSALKLEADLIAEKYADAIIKVLSFIDSALLDHVENQCEKIDELLRQLKPKCPIPDEYIKTYITNPNDKKRIFKEAKNGFYEYDFAEKWETVFKLWKFVELFRLFEKCSGTFDYKGNKVAFKHVRNHLVHSYADPELVKNAIEFSVKENIICYDNGTYSFFKSHFIQSILKKFNYLNPDTIYSTLTDNILEKSQA